MGLRTATYRAQHPTDLITAAAAAEQLNTCSAAAHHTATPGVWPPNCPWEGPTEPTYPAYACRIEYVAYEP
jgi:hypothetical protein